MSDERDAIERLERRVAQLEALVRELIARGGSPSTSGVPPASRLQPPAPPAPRAPRVPQFDVAAGAAPREPSRDLEQLIGQRGLLVVGVLALIATAGFFLKYAFDRGWVSPELRVLGGVVAGVAIAVFGERLVMRGLRGYGAALIGGGGALVYLACWAAAAAYGLVSRPVGTGLLFATTAAVALRAVFHRVEGLTVWALIGAYLAPVFLPNQAVQPAWFCAYVALVGGAAGALAVRYGWRTTLDVALLGYYVLPLALTPDALATVAGRAYVSAGGIGALVATAGRAWPEARLGGGLLAWITLLQYTDLSTPEPARWSTLVGGAALTALAWWQGRTQALFLRGDQQTRLFAGEASFLLHPVAFASLAHWFGPRDLRGWEGVLPGLTAALYLASGWVRRTPHFVALGFALAAIAAVQQWNGTAVAVALAVLSVGAVAADHRYDVRPGREVGFWLAAAALFQVFVVNTGQRPSADPAFVGSWALGWYVVTAGLLSATRLWPQPAAEVSAGRQWLWVGVGVSVFLGGSIELPRSLDGLAADLSISAFWIVYAGALVQLGFQRAVKAIRSAGLSVAGLAVAKIVLYDLSNLSALYRVGSFFILSLITLAVAYGYNRRAKDSGA